ncbi:Zinc metalloprotease [hydrothermal vent metagenome]|uniref:Zinc metalloprotease n=1 Tax=hydrothermal vent metagenome TaxID=652676 RepID=A0A3B0T8Z3_9ZZZZ
MDGVARRRMATAMVRIEGENVPLKVNWHARATRFILRLDAVSGGARLTLPAHANLDDAIGFLKSHEKWLLKERRLLRMSQVDGDEIPLRGKKHQIIALDSGPRRVWVDGNTGEMEAPQLMISGPAETATSRMIRWLKTQARVDLEAAVAHHAERLDVEPHCLAVRDQRSRWGSCSSTGTLSFSWRLIMAPPSVLDYVAAHEVAHLRELNHSPRFWKLVRATYGDTGRARSWLRANGQGLHRYGR